MYIVLQAYIDSHLNSRLTVKNNICFAGKVQGSELPLQGYDCNTKILNYAVCKIKGYFKSETSLLIESNLLGNKLYKYRANFITKNFQKNEIPINAAPKCGSLPLFSNGQTIGPMKDYYGKTVTYRCDQQFSFTDGSPIKSITCYPNENGTLYWRGFSNFTCEKSKCSTSSEFSIPGVTNLNPNLLVYELETTVKYTCPNGLQRKAACKYNPMLSKASWEYEGRCVGQLYIIFSGFTPNMLIIFMHFIRHFTF